MTAPLALPSRGRITNGFRSQPTDGKPSHLALDFGWGNGKEVYAAATGTMRYDWSVGYGHRLSIIHDAPIAGKQAVSRYAHLSSPLLRTARPTRALLISQMGNSGSFAEFDHLHFELLLDGKKSNPINYFTDVAGGGGTPISPTGPKLEEYDMEMIYWKPTATSTSWAIWGVGVLVRIGKQDSANELKAALVPDKPSRLVTLEQANTIIAFAESSKSTAVLADAQIEELAHKIAAAAPAAMGATPTQVLDIVGAAAQSVKAAIPTAAANGAAARAAIVVGG